MTSLAKIENTCSVCGAVSKFMALRSTNSFGSPDLDLRPAPMKRDTMSYWYQECPKCGYISDNVSDPCKIEPEFLKSEEYLGCEGISFQSELAKKFYKEYLIKLKSHSDEKAFYAILHAAWACDDKKDFENSSLCRNKAIPLLTKLITDKRQVIESIQKRVKFFISKKKIEEQQADLDTLLVMKSDILRRSGNFEQLISEYRNVKFEQPLLDQILAFEIRKSEQQDTACYRVSDVTG